jgi:sulfatase modifying factor 1
VTIPLEKPRDPYSPRPIDLPTPVPLDGPLDGLDGAKILAAPDDPAEWPVWRDALARWRRQAAERVAYDDGAYRRPELAWTRRCFAVALVWLWDELLYDHAAGHFTPDRFCDESEREFGGFDAVVLWHAYPVLGLDERNQFDFYRDVPDLRVLVDELHRRGVHVFVDYNPWDVGTRREPGGDAETLAAIVESLGADGVFLDTMKEAGAALRAALPIGLALEGESNVPLERIGDHTLSWAQWFADSAVPGVLRARWFEQRHMLHHTRRWNRDHADELQSAWLNGVGILVWENVFGAWVGWSDRDKAMLRAMLVVQRRHADLLANGEWTPLAAHGGGIPPEVVASRWTDGTTVLYAVANRGARPFSGTLEGADVHVTVPARGLAAVVDGEQVMTAPHGEPAAFPVRLPKRAPPPAVRAGVVPEDFVEVSGVPALTTAVFRRRETGTYGEAPFVDEWKPLPPRLHDLVEVSRATVAAPRFAIARREVSNAEYGADGPPDEAVKHVDLAEARAFAASVGARLPTEDEWQVAAERGLLERREPLVWNWTESEHTDGRTRFAILKGGSAWSADGSDWYADGGPQEPAFSLKLLLLGAGLARSRRIGFRLAVDLP